MFSSALKSFSSNITSNYTISSTPSATAGAWKVFDGTKKSTGKAVSIFVFDRKSLEPHAGGLRSRSNGASRRKVHDQVVERLKKEAGALARLRHPNILELAEPVEDTRNGGLMFATEQITATLAGLLQGQDDSGGRGRSRSYQDQEATRIERQTVEIDELEIQKGLLQVAKGLEFLHESAGLVHGNLTPEAIFVNQKSDWKISGLSFSGPPDSSSTATNGHPIALSELLYNDPRLPRTVQLNLDYTSPDFVMDSTISSAADMFSLGLVMISLYNSPHESPLHTNGNISTYKKLFTSSTTVPSASNNFLSSKPVPREVLSNVLPKLITRKAANRMTARQFQESRFFDNILVSAIRFLDSLPTKSANEKSQFLRGLPRVLEQFPKSVLEKKLLPALLEETKDKELLALILGNIFKIVTILSSAERAVSDKVLPKLRELFPLATAKTSADRDTGKDAALGIILENIDLLAKNCSSKDFKDYVIPIVHNGFASSIHGVIDKALNTVPTIISASDFLTVKNDLFPMVAVVFSKTNSLAIKVRCLEAFGILCGGTLAGSTLPKSSSNVLDKFTVQEKIMPLLKGMKTKEPAVMMAALAVLKQVGVIAETEFLAVEALPILWSFSLGPLLNLQQFQEFMVEIKAVSHKIEQEQVKKLRDLATNSSNGTEAIRSNDLMSVQSSSDPFASQSVGEDDFERLVLGKGSAVQPALKSQVSLPASPNAWHSNPTSPMNNILQPQTNISRTITPDHSLGGFTPMKPTSPPPVNSWGTNSMQTMHHMQPSMPASNPWGSPPMAPFASSGWAPAPPPAMNSSIWNNTRPQTLQPTLLNRTVEQSVPLGNQFSLQPPPSVTSSVTSSVPQAPAPKAGLDKYESLI